MEDTGFSVPPEKRPRLARALPTDPETGRPQSVPNRAEGARFDCGGGCALSTAGDYLRFAQMLANGGQLHGVRILAPATVRLMTADHLAGLNVPEPPGALGTPGYGFGLGFAVRLADGVAAVPGNEGQYPRNGGQYMWAGYGGTYFWVDPEAELVGVFMSAAPSVQRSAHRRLVQTLVYSALME